MAHTQKKPWLQHRFYSIDVNRMKVHSTAPFYPYLKSNYIYRYMRRHNIQCKLTNKRSTDDTPRTWNRKLLAFIKLPSSYHLEFIASKQSSTFSANVFFFCFFPNLLVLLIFIKGSSSYFEDFCCCLQCFLAICRNHPTSSNSVLYGMFLRLMQNNSHG